MLKKLLLSILFLFAINSICLADGISPLKKLRFEQQATANITSANTPITRTSDGYVTIFPIDGDVRINFSATASATEDPIIKQDLSCTTMYLLTNETLNLISDDGTDVVVSFIVENY